MYVLLIAHSITCHHSIYTINVSQSELKVIDWFIHPLIHLLTQKNKSLFTCTTEISPTHHIQLWFDYIRCWMMRNQVFSEWMPGMWSCLCSINKLNDHSTWVVCPSALGSDQLPECSTNRVKAAPFSSRRANSRIYVASHLICLWWMRFNLKMSFLFSLIIYSFKWFYRLTNWMFCFVLI